MRKMFKRMFEWAFKDELEHMRTTATTQDAVTKEMRVEINALRELQVKLNSQERKLTSILGNIQVDCDVNRKSGSWAVISIEGEPISYLKFVDLGKADMIKIAQFLAKFDRRGITASPADHALITGKITEIRNEK